MLKMDFFISPAYCVPPMSTIFLAEVDHDEDFGVGAVALGIGQKAGGADDGELGLVAFQLFRGGPDEKLAHEQVVPGVFVDELDGQPILGIGAAVEVLHEQFFACQIFQHALIKRVEDVGRDGQVDGAPVDCCSR